MKTAVLLLATLTLGVCAADAAVAASGEHLTDVQYIQANRCRGLAAGLGMGDTATLDSLIKTEGRSRFDTIYERGQEAQVRARREASSQDAKDRLNAELNGACMAYLSGAKNAVATAR